MLEGNLCPSLYLSQSRSCQNSSTDHRSKHKMGPIRAIPDGRGSTGLQPKVGARCKVLSLCTARLRGGKQRYYYRRTSCLIITHNGSFQLKLYKTLTADKNLGHRAIRKKNKTESLQHTQAVPRQVKANNCLSSKGDCY